MDWVWRKQGIDGKRLFAKKKPWVQPGLQKIFFVWIPKKMCLPKCADFCQNRQFAIYMYMFHIFFFIIASLLIQKGIMSSSALSEMLVKCDYCGKEMLKNFFLISHQLNTWAK